MKTFEVYYRGRFVRTVSCVNDRIALWCAGVLGKDGYYAVLAW